MFIIRFDSRHQATTALLLTMLSITMLQGCVYKEPPPEKIDLIETLVLADSTLSEFSYDLYSPVMLPFLTDLGNRPFSSNILTQEQDVTITLPFVSMRPEAIVLQISPQEKSIGRGYLEVYLNDTKLGLIGVHEEISRQMIVIKQQTWIPLLNRILLKIPSGDTTIAVENLWLLKDKTVDIQDLEPGNRFTGWVAFPEEMNWVQSIFMAPESRLSFPLFLPAEKPVLHCEALADKGNDVFLELSLVTARAFGSDERLETEVLFKNADQWIPVKWDLTPRKGRHAILHIHNKSTSAVMFRDATIKSMTTIN